MTAPPDDCPSLAPGSHLCWAYRSEVDHHECVARYFRAGLIAGEQLAYYHGPGHDAGRLLQSLADDGLDVDELVATRTLLVIDGLTAYAPNGMFDPDARLHSYAGLAHASVRGGFTGLRAMCETSWLPGVVVSPEDWLAYELRADVLFADLPVKVVCAYEVSRTDATTMSALTAVHRLHYDAHHTVAPPMFRLRAGDGGGLALSGEVDFCHANRLEQWLSAALPHLKTPSVDISGLHFVDVAGMRAVVNAVHSTGMRIRFEGGSGLFRRIWGLAGFPPDGVEIAH